MATFCLGRGKIRCIFHQFQANLVQTAGILGLKLGQGIGWCKPGQEQQESSWKKGNQRSSLGFQTVEIRSLSFSPIPYLNPKAAPHWDTIQAALSILISSILHRLRGINNWDKSLPGSGTFWEELQPPELQPAHSFGFPAKNPSLGPAWQSFASSQLPVKEGNKLG